MQNTHNAVIVGGGPSGLASALALANAGLAVAVIEQTNYKPLRVGEHLSPKGLDLLTGFNFPATLLNSHQDCYSVSSCWQTQDPEIKDYLFYPPGKGKNLDRPLFDQQLCQHAQQQGVHIVANARLGECQQKHDDWHLSLNTEGETITFKAKYLVDATGRHATLARMLGATTTVADTQLGLCAVIDSPTTTDTGSLLIEAEEMGWWYSANINAKQSIVTFFTDDAIFKQQPGKPVDFWLSRLERTQHTISRLNGNRPDAVLVRSASSQITQPMVGPGWLCTGDAAIAYDPLSSMGITKAFADAEQIALAITGHINGNERALASYQQAKVKQYQEYSEMRRSFYRQVERWPQSPFWQTRQQHTGANNQSLTG